MKVEYQRLSHDREPGAKGQGDRGSVLGGQVPDLSIIVPTYKEVDNLRSLVERLFRAALAASIGAELIIVDDDSQDGTEETCRVLANDYNLHLITRRGTRGLSTAVLAGFRVAKGRFLVCMDADLSHPPEAIPDMYSRLVMGADFVVGSRFVDGGVIEEQWGLYRRLNSRFARVLARPLASVQDPLSGFFGLPRSKFEQACELSPLGYKIGLELLVKLRPQRIAEIPIRFANRRLGRSKLSLRIQLEYLRHLRALYIHRFPFWAEAVHFLIAGGIGLWIDLTVYTAAQAFAGLNHIAARALSFVCAATHNWFLNRQYTFAGGRRRRPLPQWALYLSVMAGGMLVNVGTYVLLTTVTGGFAERRYLALLTGVALGTASNFVLARSYVFSRVVGAGLPGRRL